MSKIVNNQELAITSGTYTLKATGALTIQWDLNDGTGFSEITDGKFTAARSALAVLPACTIRIVGAGTNTLTIV
jgi:hypothetical protein